MLRSSPRFISGILSRTVLTDRVHMYTYSRTREPKGAAEDGSQEKTRIATYFSRSSRAGSIRRPNDSCESTSKSRTILQANHV